MQGYPSSNHRRLIGVGLMNDLATTNREFFICPVERRQLLACSAHIDNTIMVSHLSNKLGSLIRIRGIEHGATEDGTKHGQIFQGHLRGTILTDRDTGMRADQA